MLSVNQQRDLPSAESSTSAASTASGVQNLETMTRESGSCFSGAVKCGKAVVKGILAVTVRLPALALALATNTIGAVGGGVYFALWNSIAFGLEKAGWNSGARGARALAFEGNRWLTLCTGITLGSLYAIFDTAGSLNWNKEQFKISYNRAMASNLLVMVAIEKRQSKSQGDTPLIKRVFDEAFKLVPKSRDFFFKSNIQREDALLPITQLFKVIISR